MKVPSVTLHTLLARLPERIRIPLLKVDVESYDLEVLASAGAELEKVERIVVECVGTDYDAEKANYVEGKVGSGCWTISELLARHGFLV